MADLTDEDVSEMQRFLTATCADLKRWLPEPEWRPGWQSEAAGERANQENGPNGPWGPDPVRSVYVAAALYLELVLQSLRALAASLTPDSTHYVPNCLARAAMEAGSQAFWLLEPGIGARRRVARFMLIRASGARYRAEQVRLTDPEGTGSYGETPELAADFAASLGLSCHYRPKGKYRGEWWCEDQKLPGYTERNRLLEDAMFTAAAYSIYSGALHAEWNAVIGNWEQVTLEDGTIAMVSRPDRVAVWGAVLVAAAPAVVPAARAVQLLGHHARLAEIDVWVGRSLDLMRRMNLPPEWWRV
jgi:hypothetical protein